MTRDQRQLLTAVRSGLVYRAASGAVMRRVRLADGGTRAYRCDRVTRQAVDAGWVVLGRDGSTYRLTSAGASVLDGAR